MKKTLLLIFILVSATRSFCQVPQGFINKNTHQVREYLQTKMSAAEWDEYVLDNLDSAFCIMPYGNVGVPIASWYFDKKGKCYNYSFTVNQKQEPTFYARFKQSKLKFDPKNEGWIDSKNQTYWTVKNGSVTADRIK